MRLNWRASVKVSLLAAARAGVRVVELVEPEPLLALLAVDERVGEVRQVAGRLPHRRRAEDRRVEADDVVAQLHHRPPPGVLHVAEHQHAEGPVVVGGPEAAVDLGAREHEAAALAQVDDLVEQRRIRRGRHGRRLPVASRRPITRWGRTARWRTPWRSRIRPRSCGRRVARRRSSTALIVLVPDVPARHAPASSTLEVDDLAASAEQFCDDLRWTRPTASASTPRTSTIACTSATTAPRRRQRLPTGSSSFLLLVVLQGLTGWTPGKLLTGHPRGARGRQPAGVREGAGALGALDRRRLPVRHPGLTGFIVALSTPGHRRVGDMAAKTFVVKRAAAGTPIASGTAASSLVGEPAAGRRRPAWAPPPAAPGAPTGWGAGRPTRRAGPARLPPRAGRPPRRRAAPAHRGPAVGRGARHLHPVGSRPGRVDAVGRGLQGLDRIPGQ